MTYVRTVLMVGTVAMTFLFPVDRPAPDTVPGRGGWATVGGDGTPRLAAKGGVPGETAARAGRRSVRPAVGAVAPGPKSRSGISGGTAKPVVSAQALRRPTLFDFLRGKAGD